MLSCVCSEDRRSKSPSCMFWFGFWIVVSCKDTMIAALLGKNDVDEIDQAHVKITAALNLVVTQAKAVKGAVNDLLAAKRSREKEVERQQQAAKRKAEQAAVKEERKRQRQNEEETARRRVTDQTQSHRIDKLLGTCFARLASACTQMPWP